MTLDSWRLLKVSRPLPGRLAEPGEFVMEVSFHGDPPDWWITLDGPARTRRRRSSRDG